MTTIRVYLLNDATGERTTVQIPDTMPVNRARVALVGQLHLPPGEYQLLFERSGKRLPEGKTLSESGVTSGTYLSLRENRRKGGGQAVLGLLIGIVGGLGSWAGLFLGTLRGEGDFLRETWGIGNAGILICLLGVLLAIQGQKAVRKRTRTMAVTGLWLSGAGVLASLGWMILSGVAWITY